MFTINPTLKKAMAEAKKKLAATHDKIVVTKLIDITDYLFDIRMLMIIGLSLFSIFATLFLFIIWMEV